MKKKHNVVMLATDDKTELVIESGLFKDKYSHLYITSDEEIKEGDWYYNTLSGCVMVVSLDDNIEFINDTHYKIIATTDPMLTKPSEVQYGNMLMKDINEDGSWYNYRGETEFSLSREELIKRGVLLYQIPQSFIQEYVKQGGIDKVLVEYELDHVSIIDQANGEDVSNDWLLKLTNNEIHISLPEPKLYTREEVEIKCSQAYKEGKCWGKGYNNTLSEDDWIKENL